MYLKILEEKDLIFFNAQKNQIKSLAKNWKEEFLKRKGLKFSLIKNGEVVAILGLQFDVYLRAWFLLKEESKKYLLSITKFLKNTLTNETVFILVESNCLKSEKWADFLGFNKFHHNFEKYSLWFRTGV